MWMATVRTIFKSDTDPSPLCGLTSSSRVLFFQTLAKRRRTAQSELTPSFTLISSAADDVFPGAHAFGQSATFLTHLATDIDGTHYGLRPVGVRRARLPRLQLHECEQCARLRFPRIADGCLDRRRHHWCTILQHRLRGFRRTIHQLRRPPEPSTLAALAFGGAGLAAAAYRRRKKAPDLLNLTVEKKIIPASQ